MPGAVFDGHFAVAFIERVDGDSEAVGAPSAISHEGFEPVASVILDVPIAQ
ncbi:hypothetical protein MBRU_12060 [Mycolicibacterium brumae DSM 44177]|nr:hypothetical protein MBRU_12060 [Mycolicibacterium brumae DSM 44177]